MATHAIHPPTARHTAPPTNHLGLWSALSTAILAIVALLLAVTTLPRSGPFCVAECIGYPYTDAAALVPHDYWWMYPAMLMVPAFMVLVAALHHTATPARKQYTLIALCFAIAATTIHVTNYSLQLTVMQPSLLKGELAALSLLSQYNPHGVFIALEGIDYLLLSVALPFAALGLESTTWPVRAVKWLFAVALGAMVIALVWLTARFGADLEYRFEVAAILIDWLALIVGGALLAWHFWRAR